MLCYIDNRKKFYKVAQGGIVVNILLSLLIYNPIEAYTMILLCDTITGNNTKFSKRNILLLFLFGTVNFVIQYLPNFIENDNVFCVLMFAVCYVTMPFSLKYFYHIISLNNISMLRSVMAIFVSCIIIMVISSVFSVITNQNNILCNHNNLSEFIINTIIHILQIVVYNYIKRKSMEYEKFCKRNRK
mgnify:CR=1 FL=1